MSRRTVALLVAISVGLVIAAYLAAVIGMAILTRGLR